MARKSTAITRMLGGRLSASKSRRSALSISNYTDDGTDGETTGGEIVHPITQNETDDTEVKNDEEANEMGTEEETNTAAFGTISPYPLLVDDSTIVELPEKSHFSLFLYETSAAARKSLSVADFEYSDFDQAIGKFPQKLALLIRSN